MGIILTFILLSLLAIVLIPFTASKWKGIIAIITVTAIALLSSIYAIRALTGINIEYIFPGSYITGDIPIRIDALSGWFILIINFTLITGGIYGFYYMKAYRFQKANLSVHSISYILVHSSLISICSLQNSIVFLFAWEIMALSSFLLIIFEQDKLQTIKAGINFLIQSHISVIFLSIAFIWVAVKMNSYDFKAIYQLTSVNILSLNLILFFMFFTGFAIKSGFVPFHTWLPYAHPSAPSHVSGVMSGVIIKIGIYGILRMLLLIKSDYTTIGYIILVISVITGVYGVMLAIIQHNLKKLLAYHSIENIGIIGIGIGLGCIGLGRGNETLALLGLAGALLHTLNHSLFKSLLFYGAGNVYQATHKMNMEQLGGLIKKMPHTAILFLIAALAICGLPPFNGFISEFLIYSGLISGIPTSSLGLLFAIVFSLLGLVLIGGLAIMCFTKAFGIVFSGTPRSKYQDDFQEAVTGKLIPMYAIVAVILAIGLFPQHFLQMLSEPIKQFCGINTLVSHGSTISTLRSVGICSSVIIALSGLIFLIKTAVTKTANRDSFIVNETWGCGYIGNADKMQYTASSYIRTYRKLAEPLLQVFKKKKEIKGIFPSEVIHETHPYDKIENRLIDIPLRNIRYFFNRFAFLQNGRLQSYILYGVIFIILILLTPVLYEKLKSIFNIITKY